MCPALFGMAAEHCQIASRGNPTCNVACSRCHGHSDDRDAVCLDRTCTDRTTSRSHRRALPDAVTVRKMDPSHHDFRCCDFLDCIDRVGKHTVLCRRYHAGAHRSNRMESWNGTRCVNGPAFRIHRGLLLRSVADVACHVAHGDGKPFCWRGCRRMGSSYSEVPA
ncbi:MAG: hypothetical protein RL081_1804 [Pseudomonadota bacterium]